MKKWNIYQRGEGEIEVIKEGFNWWALLFSWIWAFDKKLSLAGFGGLFLTVFTARISRVSPDYDLLVILMGFGVPVVFGFMGNGWVAAKLQREGYSHARQIAAASAENAKEQFRTGDSSSQTGSP